MSKKELRSALTVRREAALSGAGVRHISIKATEIAAADIHLDATEAADDTAPVCSYAELAIAALLGLAISDVGEARARTG